jgi:hypothetical protein
MPNSPERADHRLPDEPGVETTCRQDFEIHGHFWLPCTPHEKVAGVLHHSNGQIHLTLLGQLGPPQEIFKPQSFTPDVVLGQSYKGTLVTLLKCRQSFSERSLTHDTGQSQLVVSILLVGVHRGDEADPEFHGITGSFSNLEEWVGHNPFTTNYRKSEATGGFTGHTTEYAPLDTISFTVPAIAAEVALSARFGNGGSSPFHGWQGRHIATLAIKPKRPERLSVLLGRLHDIGNLLSLLIGEEATPLRTALSGDVLPVEGGSFREDHPLFITGRFSLQDTKVHPHEMLLGYPRLRTLFPEIVESWFSKKDVLDPSASLLLGVLATPHMFLDFRFLALMQAVEAFCRRCCAGKYMPDQAYAEVLVTLCKAIPEKVPRDLKNSLVEGKLKYGNEYSLRKRLRDLLKTLAPDTLALVTESDGEFAKWVVNIRNDLTHLSPDSAQSAYTSRDLLKAYFQLRVLLTIVLLKHLGIPEEMIRDAYRTSGGALAQIVRQQYAAMST